MPIDKSGKEQCGLNERMVGVELGTGSVDVDEEEEDRLRLLTHLIASDVLYGQTALEPLSSVVSALKLRNPDIIVILLLRERSPNAVEDLKSQIEAKVRNGLLLEEPSKSEMPSQQRHPSAKAALQGFGVSVRDVVHNIDTVANMKMVEC